MSFRVELENLKEYGSKTLPTVASDFTDAWKKIESLQLSGPGVFGEGADMGEELTNTYNNAQKALGWATWKNSEVIKAASEALLQIAKNYEKIDNAYAGK